MSNTVSPTTPTEVPMKEPHSPRHDDNMGKAVDSNPCVDKTSDVGQTEGKEQTTFSRCNKERLASMPEETTFPNDLSPQFSANGRIKYILSLVQKALDADQTKGGEQITFSRCNKERLASILEETTFPDDLSPQSPAIGRIKYMLSLVQKALDAETEGEEQTTFSRCIKERLASIPEETTFSNNLSPPQPPTSGLLPLTFLPHVLVCIVFAMFAILISIAVVNGFESPTYLLNAAINPVPTIINSAPHSNLTYMWPFWADPTHTADPVAALSNSTLKIDTGPKIPITDSHEDDPAIASALYQILHTNGHLSCLCAHQLSWCNLRSISENAAVKFCARPHIRTTHLKRLCAFRVAPPTDIDMVTRVVNNDKYLSPSLGGYPNVLVLKNPVFTLPGPRQAAEDSMQVIMEQAAICGYDHLRADPQTVGMPIRRYPHLLVNGTIPGWNAAVEHVALHGGAAYCAQRAHEEFQGEWRVCSTP